MEAACAVKEDLRILAVTVLTSLDQRDLDDAIAVGFETGHFHVDPDEAAGVLRHCEFA